MQYNDAAQAQMGNESDAVLPAAAPSGSDTGAPPAGSITKQQRDIQAQAGREIAAANRRAADAEARANAALVSSQRTEQYIAQQQQDQYNAYLNSLPPEQRAVAEANAEAKAARQDVANLREYIQRQQAPPQQQGRSNPLSTEEIQARKAEILSEIAQETGVALTGQEAGIDDSRGELAFRASVRAVAVQASARNDQGESAYGPGPGRPISPRPISGSAVVTSENIQEAMWAHSSEKPWETKKRLQALRDQARIQAGVR